LRRPWRRPTQRTSGPATGAPSGLAIAPARRSCTYFRNASFAASFETFGRLARRSACHCAVVARYTTAWLRVDALRRSSLEIVDADRPRRAIPRTPTCWAWRIAISSRSANDKYRPDTGASEIGGIPPPSRNHRTPTGTDTPAAPAASSVDRPAAIARQKRCRSSRRAIDGRPGDHICPRIARIAC